MTMETAQSTQDANGKANSALTTERLERLRRMGFQPGEHGRGRIPRRVLALFDSFAADFGGPAMSQATRAELMLACNLIYKVEQTKDADVAAKAGNSVRHILDGLRRRVKASLPQPLETSRSSLLRDRLRGM
jgi:hypothetical protein